MDLRILSMAMDGRGTFNENDMANSDVSKFGTGEVLDCLASLRERKILSLNPDGSFSVTDLARNILWCDDVPGWVRILRLLQTRSCSTDDMSTILHIHHDKILDSIHVLRQKHLVMMSPQRQHDKVVRVYEILSEGTKELDRMEAEGYDVMGPGGSGREQEIMDLIDEVMLDINRMSVDDKEKGSIMHNMSRLKDLLGI